MRKLLIAQHSETAVDCLTKTLQADWDIHICMDSYPIVDILQYMKPEAMIIDLNIGPENGISVLKEGQPFLPPAIVATSNYIDDQVAETLEQYGVGSLVRIPFRAEYIKEQLECLMANYPEGPHGVLWHLRALGVNPKLSGYQCLLNAIPIYQQHPYISFNKELYPAVAHICHLNDWRCVERSIRTAINDAWHQRNLNIWYQYFPKKRNNDIARPSNKYFIATIANKVK